MGISEFFIKLKTLKINIKLVGERLDVKAPKGVLTKELVNEIKDNKEKLIIFLANEKRRFNHSTIPKTNLKDYYSLSSAQKRLYLLQQMDLKSVAYNMPYVISLGMESDKAKIEEVLHQLISRHESFRTSIVLVDGEPVQKINKEVDFKVEELSIENTKVEQVRKKIIRPFDLSQAPILRAAIVDIKGSNSLLMIDMHHIISDGTSHSILEKEFQALYSGEDLGFLPLQYRDYSEWQYSKEQQEVIKEQEEYWLNKFEGEIPVLNLQKDYVRPVIQSHDGATVSFSLSKEETLQIKSLANENDLTLYMLVLSIFTVLLSKLSGQEDIIVGTPTAGRNHSDLEDIVGVFINTLAIRNEVNGSNTVKEFLGKLKQSTLEAFENQDYQFEDLVDKISVERDISRNPLFDVMFNFLNHADYLGDLSGLSNDQYVHIPGISKFDLSLTSVDYGDQLLCNFTYCTRLFKPERIERFIGYFKQILNKKIQNPDSNISEIDILSLEEKKQLLHEFNNTKTDYPKNKTIHQLFEEQVGQTPDYTAVVYNNQCISYSELNLRSNQLAQLLLSKGINPEDIVGVLVDRSIEMIIGVLGILKAGGTYLPLDIESPKERINYIIKESKPKVVLCQSSVYQSFKLGEECLDLFDSSLYLNYQYQDISQGKASDSAYIIYTSGSTGKPKGVIVEHGNVVNLINGFTTSIYNNYQDTLHVSLISPIFFDASVKQIFPSLTLGHSLNIIPESIRFEGAALVNYYTKHDIQIADGTPFHAQMLAQYLDDKTHGLNIRQFILGGDELKLELMQSLFQKINVKDLKISNVYGPTECTDVATIKTSTIESLKEKGNPSIGKPISNYEIFILGKNLELLPVGVSGELCISGEGVSRGYLFNEELTSEKFITHPYKEGERLYKTGDLARWLPDGDIEFLGRIDHQVKIRGFRIELGEIESILLKHKNIKESVVLAREENGEKYLCAYLITEKDFNQEEIRTYLSAILTDYMIPSYFVQLEKLPLTSNGKVNRKALPSPEIKAGDDYIAPSNATEEKLVEIWSEVLNIEKEEISTSANFFVIGGHSLKASVLTGRIHKETGVEFPLRDVFLHSSIQAQASQIIIRDKKDFISIPKAKDQDYYYLSSAQKRLYLLQQMDLESTAYNMPYTIPIGTEAEKEKIEDAFVQLIKRHESFRTSFEIEGEELTQRIHEQVEFKIEEVTITIEEVQNYKQKFIQAFDLRKAPLIRVSKVDVKGEDSLLMIDMHHIISDGVSHGILEQDFQRLYSGEELPDLKLQYKDYSQWQNSHEQQAKVKKQEVYWLRKFEEEIPVLDLPLDYVRPVMQSHEGASVSFALSKEETQHMKSFAKENDLTLYMSILSVFSILLSKLGGQEDIIVGTPIAGRNHTDLEGVVGMLVNTLAIRNNVEEDQTLLDYLQGIKQTTLEAFENQDYQFEELVENISIERDISRNPLFDVMFSLLNQEADIRVDLLRLECNKYVHKPGLSKFDLTLTAVDYGEQLSLIFEYCTKLFKAETIERYIGYFKQIVNQLTIKSERELSEIEIISEEEKQQLLYEFNDTQVSYPSKKSIAQVFDEQVKQFSKKIVLEDKDKSYTYQDLDEESNKIANYLTKRGVAEEQLVGLVAGRSSDMIIAILGILKTGGAYVPIDPAYPKERVNQLIEDSDINILLSTEQIDFECNLSESVINIKDLEISESSTDFSLPALRSSNIAYVMYTSGSTGTPKGVVIEQKSVLRLVKDNQFFPFHLEQKILMTGAPVFDATSFEIWGALLNGGSLYIASNDVLINAELLGGSIRENSITSLWLTSSLFNQLTDQDESIFDTLDYLLVGGDVLSIQHINKIKSRNSELVIINGYGPTENTTFSTTFNIEKEYVGNIPIGKPISNSTAYIFDRRNRLQAVGVPGELLVGGDGLAREYLNNPELTREKFIENPYKEDERLYRTGDLARWLPDGNIEFLGRIDHQVKIRGFRIELGEIENALLKHESINESVVLDREENGDKYLCAYVVCKEKFSNEELRAYMSEQLPAYMVPSYFVELDKLPLTSNGKVNRKALPSPQIKAGNDYVSPSNAIEEKLVEIWSEVLNVEKEEISVTANFFSIGGHSLKASVLTGRIYKEIGVELPLRDVFLYSTIRDQAGQIDISTKKDFVSIPKAKDRECYPLSSAQKRLYLLQQMDLDSTAYNMPYVIPLGTEVNEQKIEEAFRQLVKRHESFRTSFSLEREEPVQRIHEQVEFTIEKFSIEKEEVQEKRQEFIQAFDLSQAPLLRAAKVDVKGEGCLLMIDMHHIISDGVSHAILEQDFRRLYSGEYLPELKLQYKDYSQWQNSQEQQVKVKKQEDYWGRKFEDEIPVLDIPTDCVRPVIQSHEGASVSFALSKEETQHIKLLAKENGLTLFMSVLSVFKILLSKLSGQEDVIVGTPIAGRNHSDLENIVGVFINTLAIRNEVNGSNTLKEFLGKLKQSTLEVFENQDFKFEDLVEKISVERDISRNPIFDVMFNLLNQAEYSADLTGLESQKYIHTSGISKFDLTLTAVDYGEQLLLSFEYCTKLFKAVTIERYIGYFKRIVNQLTINPEIELLEIEIISKEEKHQLLYEFNNTKADYPKDKTIHLLFEEQVAKTPANIAVSTRYKSINYKELHEKAENLAYILRSNGVTSGSVVSLMLDRSIEMIIALMGILKAGCCYLPILPSMPKSRLDYVLADSESPLILTQTKYAGNLVTRVKSINLEELDSFSCSHANSDEQNNPNSLAYIIYTSGTTGNPKGVMIENHSVVNRIKWMQKNYPIGSGDIILQKTPYTFDVSVWELFWWSFEGASVYMLEPEGEKDPQLISKTIEEKKINVMHFVPSMLEAFINVMEIDSQKSTLGSMKYVFSSGEALRPNQVHSFYKLFIDNVHTKLVNLYGPTEATVDVSYFDCLRDVDYKSIPIGKPIDNTELYILDKNSLQVQAVGIIGELMISGVGLSQGYLKKDELTNEKFIDHPYEEGVRLYRTGDLARWLPDGNIEFLGRIDHQVKIRGFRIELGEIENALLKHESIKESVVLAREENGEKYLCAYLITEKDFNQEEIRTYLSASLTDYMIPSYFVQLEKLPLTSNGKVNRKALPSPEIKAGVDYIAPSNAIEEKLVEIWSEVLNIEKEEISVTANFFAIGGHSLKASVLTGRIHKEIGVEFPLRDVFLHSSIQAQASQISKSTKKEFVSILKAKEQSYYPLSSAQKRLYLLQQFDLTSMAYNMPYVIPLGKEVDKGKIEDVFIQLINRHDSFRTSFEIEGETPVQRIHESVDFSVKEITTEKDEVQNYRQQFIHAFDLSLAPLLRVSKIDVKGEGSLLMIDMHHIISDGVSHEILEQDFKRLYSGEELAPLSLQYKDYSEWQNSEEQQAKVKKQEDYWISKFEEEIPVLNLPIDYTRPVIQSHEGATVSFSLSKEETEQIRTLANENDLTLYMSVLSIFTILLSKLSGQEDIIVGTPIAGRNHSDLENIVGVFINTLAIRNEVNGSNSFKEFSKKLKQSTLEAYENQDFQFEDLVGKVSVERDISRSPIFDVMFNLLNHKEYKGDLPEFKEEKLIHTQSTSKFDLTLTGVDYDEQLMFNFTYCKKLFKAETIERFIKYFRNLVKQLPVNLEEKLSSLEIITASEKQQILYDFNNTKVDYPKNKTIHQLFEEQAERTANNVAIASGEGQLSYSEFNKKSNQLAHYLRNKGVRSNSVVSLFFETSLEMLISIIGVLKSGATFLPINPELPKDRVSYMITDSGSDIMLTQNQISLDTIPDIDIVDVGEILIETNTDELKDQKYESDSTYIIYTSGTTGNPKGVVISHQNIVNYIHWFGNSISLVENDRALLTTNFTFDAIYTLLFGVLINGARLNLIPRDVYLNPQTLIKYIDKENVTLLKMTPSLFNAQVNSYMFDSESFKSVRFLMLGGEEINSLDVKKCYGYHKNLRIMNHYGPTESTVGSIATFIEVDKLSNYIECSYIGRPIDNTYIYVLNEYAQVQPIGVSGELCISGDGLSQGYINNPELTSEKFIDHPYKKGGKLYRTGDLARWMSDGNIEFLGRIDHQVKIRGHRIELDEIEIILHKHQKVKESVVLAREDHGDKYLCAYIVCEEGLDQEELRSYLSGQLANYMIPSYFVELEEMPLTLNGKVDRKALPLPEYKAGNDYVAPSNDVEQKLAKIWSKILNIPEKEISIEDDFFKLGGHSLNALNVVSAIKNEFGILLPLMHVYKFSNIKDIAKGLLGNNLVSSGMDVFNEVKKNKIFCFPPLVGYGLAFAELAKLIPEFCFYSFNFQENCDLIDFYVDKILDIENKGPYKLIGYSAGSKLVSLVAKELENRGGIVSDVILIDGYWDFKEIGKANNKAEEENFELFLKYVEDVMVSRNLDFNINEVRERIVAYNSFLKTIKDFDIINANVHLIHSSLTDGRMKKALQIQKYTRRKLFMYQGYGVHSEMLVAKNVSKNSEIIHNILNRIVNLSELNRRDVKLSSY